MSDEQDGCERVNVSFGTSLPGSPGQKAVKRLCVCVCFIKSGSKLKFCEIFKDFQIFLHLKIPWNIIVRKQAINDNLQCSVAAYLKCDQWGS